MTDVELAALSELVRAETMAMSFLNQYRSDRGETIAYTDEEWNECDSVKVLKKELHRRGVLEQL